MRGTLLLSTLFLLPACSLFRGQKDAASCGECEETSSEIPLDETTPLGISAEDVLAYAEGEHAGTLSYTQGDHAGESTALTLTVAREGDTATWVDASPSGDTEGLRCDAEALCPDRLEIPVTLGFSTEDGAFAENWSLVLAVTASLEDTGLTDGVASFSQVLEPGELSGSYTFDSSEFFDPSTLDSGAEIDEVVLEFVGEFAPGGDCAGELYGTATGPVGSDEEWAMTAPLAEWSAGEGGAGDTGGDTGGADED